MVPQSPEDKNPKCSIGPAWSNLAAHFSNLILHSSLPLSLYPSYIPLFGTKLYNLTFFPPLVVLKYVINFFSDPPFNR